MAAFLCYKLGHYNWAMAAFLFNKLGNYNWAMAALVCDMLVILQLVHGYPSV